MANFPRAEIQQTHDRYVALRDRVEAGEQPWSALAEFFTEDATFIDPAWGRVQGREAICEFMTNSMTGLEGWTFPSQWTMIEDNRLVTCWMNRLPGTRDDGSFYEAPGISTIYYAGNGLFSYEEDLLNMTHVMELIRESGWRPGPGAKAPPSPVPR